MPRSDRVEIVRVRAAGDSEWDAAWLACEHATWFHSRAWAEIWAEHRRGERETAARVVEFTDGRSALLPLSMERNRGARRFRSSPAGTYGGWLFEEPLEKVHAARLFSYLCDELPGLSWRVCPWDTLAADLTQGIGEPETTRALALEEGFEALERRFSNGARWGARRAEREGLEIGIGTELSDWRAYHALYQQSLARWGDRATSSYDWELFAAIRLRDPENSRLWVARLDGEVIAGALTFYAPWHAAWWHAAALASQLRKQPMHLLLHAIIRDACEQGLRGLDMGPSHGHAGVEAFKAAYATSTLACPMLRTAVSSWRTRARRALGGILR
jgi:hypothetical protein